MSSFQVIHCEDGLAIGEVGPVCVVIWREAVTRPRFDRQRAALAEVVRKHSPDAGFMCIVEPDVPPPSDELRKASADMMQSHQNGLRCAAGIIEGSGFKAALTRSVLSGITLLMGNRKSPMSYFATVGEASAWMAKLIPVQPAAVKQAVDSMREQLAPAERTLSSN